MTTVAIDLHAPSVKFDELWRRLHSNEVARAAGDELNFSTQIRKSLPNIPYEE